jgi:hypothetical protein
VQLGFLKSQTRTGLLPRAPARPPPLLHWCFRLLSHHQPVWNCAQPWHHARIALERLTGVPYVNIQGGAEFGNNWEGTLPQVGNSFQWSDGLTWVKGNHTFKFGVMSAAPASTSIITSTSTAK